MKFVFLGLSITSSWGNGHATTYRGLVRELAELGHDVLFLERNQEWYAANRDLPKPPYGRAIVYNSVAELKRRFTPAIRDADVAIVGSYVPQGAEIGDWVTRLCGGVTAFYDIDTPVTIANLERGELDYLTRALIRRYNIYLSFTGGPLLERIETEFGSPMARPLYCSVDPNLYFPDAAPARWDLGYMGTYSDDRQPTLERLLLQPARAWSEGRFVVAGPQYPRSVRWPSNIKRYTHLSPRRHRAFYNAQRFTLNITRANMINAGYSPSVRFFEAAACGTPIVSDYWKGLETFFRPGEEILVAKSADETLRYLRDLSETQRAGIAQRARARVLASHTARDRARELEAYVLELCSKSVAA
jgi:spore maturation protein CgeB